MMASHTNGIHRTRSPRLRVLHSGCRYASWAMMTRQARRSSAIQHDAVRCGFLPRRSYVAPSRRSRGSAKRPRKELTCCPIYGFKPYVLCTQDLTPALFCRSDAKSLRHKRGCHEKNIFGVRDHRYAVFLCGVYAARIRGRRPGSGVWAWRILPSGTGQEGQLLTSPQGSRIRIGTPALRRQPEVTLPSRAASIASLRRVTIARMTSPRRLT